MVVEPHVGALGTVTLDWQWHGLTDRLMQRFYPGAYRDGSLAFYSWVRSELRADMRILNVGAGPPTKSKVRTLRGEVAQVVGVDIDPIVLENDELDVACIIENGRLPLANGAFDLALADYVLEHIEEPQGFLRELHRVLKPGAPFFFRTPNRHHYVAMISRMTPHWIHELVANRVRRLPAHAHKPWPTHYRLNSPRAISRAAREAGFSGVDLRLIEPEPSYLVFNPLAFLMGVAYERAVNSWEGLSGLRANILGKLRR